MEQCKDKKQKKCCLKVTHVIYLKCNVKATLLRGGNS